METVDRNLNIHFDVTPIAATNEDINENDNDDDQIYNRYRKH